MPAKADSAGKAKLNAANEETKRFQLTSRGQMQTDPTLRVLGHQRIFAMGDAAGAADGFTPEATSKEAAFPSTAQVRHGFREAARAASTGVYSFLCQHLTRMQKKRYA